MKNTNQNSGSEVSCFCGFKTASQDEFEDHKNSCSFYSAKERLNTKIEHLKMAKKMIQDVAKDYRGFGEADYLDDVAKRVDEFIVILQGRCLVN